MGRKSNAKKANREHGKKKVEKVREGGIKLLDKKIKKGHAAIKTAFKLNKRKIFGGALTVIMLAILVSVGFLLFQKAFRATPIAKILPANSTIAFVEFNTNFEHNQVLKALDLLKGHPEYSKEGLVSYLAKKFSIDFDSEITPWFGRGAGIAMLSSEKDPGKVATVYFAEVTDKNLLMEKLKTTPTQNYKSFEIYKSKYPFFLIFADDYALFSNTENGIKEFIDAKSSDGGVLYSSDRYRRIDDNMPINKLGFLYLDFEKLNDGFFQSFPALSEKGFSIEAIQPFIKLFNAEGFALIAMDNNFAVQSFLSMSGDKVKNVKYLNLKEKYEANLTDYISPDALVFWGGQNLNYEIKRLIELLSGGEDSSMDLFNSLIENYAKKYFGPDINLENDILPLFGREFAVDIENINGENIYKMILELSSPSSDSVKIQNLANTFAASGGIFEPQIVEHILKDGTVGKEIIATPQEIKKTQIEYGDTTIYGLKMDEQNWGIYYAFLGKVAVLSNNADGVKNSIDLINKKIPNLHSSSVFATHFSPVLENADELSYFNFDKLLPVFFKDTVVPGPLKILGRLSSGKNYFNDGITTIHYLSIK